MVTAFPLVLLLVTSALVFAATWRMLPSQNSLSGGLLAVVLFLCHPAVFSGFQFISPLDALFVMVFLCAWIWMQNWSLFMRSWVLAGIFSFGLWIGSPFVLWGLIAMVPWVIFNRRPMAAVGSLTTVLFGGLLLFGVSWGIAWVLVPAIGRPLFTQWIRWGHLTMPASASLPWFLLVAAAVVERLREMLKNRRSDATTFAATLLVITAFLGSPQSGLALIAISAPLIARVLAKKEFLLHRRVRWVASLSFALSLGLAYAFKSGGWTETGLAMLLVGLCSWGLARKARSPRFMVAEATCVGAYFGQSMAVLLRLYPR